MQTYRLNEILFPIKSYREFRLSGNKMQGVFNKDLYSIKIQTREKKWVPLALHIGSGRWVFSMDIPKGSNYLRYRDTLVEALLRSKSDIMYVKQSLVSQIYDAGISYVLSEENVKSIKFEKCL